MGQAICQGGEAHPSGLGHAGDLDRTCRLDSVPELIAKPVIDIVLVVADSAAEARYVPDLEAAGYELQLREPDFHEHRLLRDHDPHAQIHVFTVGSPEVERMLLFRDRCTPFRRNASCINAPKRELADRQWEYIQDYAERSHQWSKRSSRGLKQISPAALLRLKGLCHGGQSRAGQRGWP